MKKILLNNICFFRAFLVIFLIIVSNSLLINAYEKSCISIEVNPLKEKIQIEDYSEFDVLIKNNCNRNLSIKIAYLGYVFDTKINPDTIYLKKGDISLVNIKVFPPKYLYSGWKAVKISILDNNNKNMPFKDRKILKNFYLKFYIYPTPKEIEKKVKYEYIILTKNLDLSLNTPAGVTSGLNKRVNFSIKLSGIDKEQLKWKDFSLVVFSKALNGKDDLKLAWDSVDSLDSKYVSFEKDSIIFKNSFLADFNTKPGLYKIEAIFNLREKDNFDLSERDSNTILIKGSPYFKIDKECKNNLYKKECIYKITNLGNLKGVYEFKEKISFISKPFLNYNFEAKFEDSYLKVNVELEAKDSKILVLEYNYLSVYLIILVIIIAGAFYYYLFYLNPLTIKKDVQKLEIKNDRKIFTIEILVKNNTPKEMRNVVVIEKIQGPCELSELSIYPKADKVKKDLNSYTIRWEISKLTPFSEKILTYRIRNKGKGLIDLKPTLVKTFNSIFKGTGLKIDIKDDFKIKSYK